MRIFMRVIVCSVLSSFVVGPMMGCASVPVDPNAEPRDRTVTTGSNIPRKGQAVIVDPTTVDNYQRSGAGTIFK